MSIDDLTSVAPPPAEPLDIPTSPNWESVERELGLRLPMDYKQYVFHYGRGGFYGFLFPANPFSTLESLAKCNEAWLEIYNIHRANQPERLPFPTYPVPGGLLCWGGSNNGDSVYWRMAGEPEAWPVVLVDSEFLGYEEYAMDMSTFLAKWVRREIVPGCFPEDLIEPLEPVFEPGG